MDAIRSGDDPRRPRRARTGRERRFPRKSLRGSRRRSDQDHPVVYMYSNPQISDRKRRDPRRRPSPEGDLKKGLNLPLGAGLLAVPCNTAHFFIDCFRGELPVPLVHIVDATTRAMRASPGGAWLIATDKMGRAALPEEGRGTGIPLSRARRRREGARHGRDPAREGCRTPARERRRDEERSPRGCETKRTSRSWGPARAPLAYDARGCPPRGWFRASTASPGSASGDSTEGRYRECVDFVFYNPTRIIFGRKAADKIGEAVAAADIRSALLIYGKGSVKTTGLYDRVRASLAQAGVEVEDLRAFSRTRSSRRSVRASRSAGSGTSKP